MFLRLSAFRTVGAEPQITLGSVSRMRYPSSNTRELSGSCARILQTETYE